MLLADFDEHLDDPKLTRRKLDWIERLAADQTRSLILLSSASPSLLDHAFRVESRGAVDPQVLERWRKVLASFVVINWRAGHPRGGPPATVKPWWRELWERLHPSPGTWRAPTELGDALQARRDRSAREALRSEAEADAFVRAVCASIEGRLAAHAAVASVAGTAMRLSPDQVLDEVAERTDAWYKRIWKTCSPDEQLVLAEIASEGFVNYKSRRTVRRLLARGLVTKDPSFRLMNTTFRRFVLSAPCQQDVHALEGTSDPSTWDRVRAPFLAALVGISLFFLVTQREMFNCHRRDAVDGRRGGADPLSRRGARHGEARGRPRDAEGVNRGAPRMRVRRPLASRSSRRRRRNRARADVVVLERLRDRAVAVRHRKDEIRAGCRLRRNRHRHRTGLTRARHQGQNRPAAQEHVARVQG